MSKPFAVVVFKDDNHVTAVPVSWISADEKSCAWPTKLPSKFTKIIKNPDSQPQADWLWLDVDLKKRYGKTKYYFVILLYITIYQSVV